jgi:nucleoid-associated protein EbfC
LRDDWVVDFYLPKHLCKIFHNFVPILLKVLRTSFHLKNLNTMFGDLLGNLDKQQAEIQKNLASTLVKAATADGSVSVTANALRILTDIKIDSTKIDVSDTEQLEDLLLVVINKALEQAAIVEAQQSEQMFSGLQDMLPPGMPGMDGLLKRKG